jgi:hypothetical protein
MYWFKLSLLIIGVLFAVVLLTTWFAFMLWNRTTLRIGNQLKESSQADQRVFTHSELDGLPPPVVRYFRSTLKEGQPMIRYVQLKQEGKFWAQGSWKTFEASQCFSVKPLAMMWDARIQMAPFVTVSVRDAYLRGKGSMLAKLMYAIPVMDAHDQAELNQGALQRYLAEAVWFPTAFLPSQGVKWTPINETKALATLADNQTSASLEFYFNDAGEIQEVFTPARYREVNGKYELTPWLGHHSRYQKNEGIRIPMEAEVEWELPEGKLPYFRAHLVAITYDFGP